MDTTKRPTISIIAAVAENKAIGKDNKLLWHIPADLQHFKKITLGHPVIMGQKTFESLERPLPDRLNIVLSRDCSFHPQGVSVASTIDSAISFASKNDRSEIFFIGGGMVYEQAIKLADKLYLTIVEGKYDADTYFPDYDAFRKMKVTGRGIHGKYKYCFCEFQR